MKSTIRQEQNIYIVEEYIVSHIIDIPYNKKIQKTYTGCNRRDGRGPGEKGKQDQRHEVQPRKGVYGRLKPDRSMDPVTGLFD